MKLEKSAVCPSIARIATCLLIVACSLIVVGCGERGPESSEPQRTPETTTEGERAPELHSSDPVNGGLMAAVAAEERRFTFQQGRLHGVNRQTDARAFFDERAAAFESRTKGPKDWQFTITATEFGREASRNSYALAKAPVELKCDPTAAAAAQPECLNQIEYQRKSSAGTVIEWWRNTSAGFEHGFDIPRRPSGSGELYIRISISGDLEPEDPRGTDEVFLTRNGTGRFRYGKLIAYDARRVEVPARFELADGGVAIVVDDSSAVYPLRIDPILEVLWTSERNQASSAYGFAVANARDLDNDGYGDIIVGAPYFDAGGVNAGQVFVFFGTANGSLTAPKIIPSLFPAAENRFGYSVDGAGDINGDGRGDIVIGEPWKSDVYIREGAVWGYRTNADRSFTALWFVMGEQASAFLGMSVAGVGNIDSNFGADVVGGSKSWDNGENSEGRIVVIRNNLASSIQSREINIANAEFGTSVAAAGDVNGDGFNDVVVGAPGWGSGQANEGRAFVYYGGPTGLGASPAWSSPKPTSSAITWVPPFRRATSTPTAGPTSSRAAPMRTSAAPTPVSHRLSQRYYGPSERCVIDDRLQLHTV